MIRRQSVYIRPIFKQSLVRRPLSDQEAAALVRAAETSSVIFRLSGQDRAMVYRVALGTGFRVSELASLTVASFALDAKPLTVTVAAAYSKRRRDDEQPIPAALADALRPYLASQAPGPPLWPLDNHHTAEMIRVDMDAAGIPYSDASGRVADSHALRATYISALVASGASVKTCQTLARHSTPSLTIGIYAKASVHDLTGAVESLPDLAPSDPTPEASEVPITCTYKQNIVNFLALRSEGTGPCQGGNGRNRGPVSDNSQHGRGDVTSR